MGILPLKKRVNRDKCSFVKKQRMFGVFAIDEILRYRWTRFASLRTLCHPADMRKLWSDLGPVKTKREMLGLSFWMFSLEVRRHQETSQVNALMKVARPLLFCLWCDVLYLPIIQAKWETTTSRLTSLEPRQLLFGGKRNSSSFTMCPTATLAISERQG